jgi:superfamily II DNA/RNA helicase
MLWKRRFRATSIHSGLSQNKRNRVIQDFNTGRYTILVATDVAARGLHIEGVTHVVNYDIPRNPKDYVHRIGRTGRAGKEGDAITFVTQIDENLLRAVEAEIKMFLEVQYITPEGKIMTPPRDKSHMAPHVAPPSHKPHPGHPIEEIKVHTHSSDTSGDDWGLD